MRADIARGTVSACMFQFRFNPRPLTTERHVNPLTLLLGRFVVYPHVGFRSPCTKVERVTDPPQRHPLHNGARATGQLTEKDLLTNTLQIEQPLIIVSRNVNPRELCTHLSQIAQNKSPDR